MLRDTLPVWSLFMSSLELLLQLDSWMEEVVTALANVKAVIVVVGQVSLDRSLLCMDVDVPKCSNTWNLGLHRRCNLQKLSIGWDGKERDKERMSLWSR